MKLALPAPNSIPGRAPIAGAVLVTTLLVIVVLAIIVTALLQNMTLDRLTSRSYYNRLQSELAAQAAQSEATQRIAKLMAANPYHGIGYMAGPGPKADDDATTNPLVPVLYAVNVAQPSPTPKIHYLISGTTDADATSLPATFEKDASVAINYQRDAQSAEDPGWIGSPVDKTGKIQLRECRAGWVYVLKDSSKPHQPDIKQAGYNPYISRFAWWAEDETSKLDVLKTGNADNTGGGFLVPKTQNLADNSSKSNPNFKDALAYRPEDLDLGAAPVKNGKPLSVGEKGDNKTLINYLQPSNEVIYPADARILNQVPGFNGFEPKARFYTTVSSISNDLAGNGRRRVNLNALVTNNASAQQIAGNLDDIAYAITGRHIFDQNARGDDGLFSSESEAPDKALLKNFGKRFWPEKEDDSLFNSTLKNKKETIYLTKIAANIRDYIDEDSYPTFVDPDGKVVTGANSQIFNADAFPVNTFPNINDNGLMPRAIGHEAIPYLAKVGFTVNFQNGTLTQNETFSFINPSTKDFVAPQGTFLKCFDRLKWKRSGSLGNFQMPAYTLDLSGITFPAGKATVVTSSRAAGTDMPTAQMTTPPQRPPLNPTSAISHSETGANAYEPYSRSTSNYDVLTKVVVYGPNGYFGGFGAVTLTSFTSGPTQYTMSSSNNSKTRGNSMQGNSSNAISYSGDARSINEPLLMNRNSGANGSGALQDQARFWDDTGINLSKVVNSYISPTLWPDYTRAFNETASTTYAIVRDQPMTSIGELGNIYDPYRRKGESGKIDFARGGGRTLRLGQPDDVTYPSSTGAPLNFASDSKKAAEKSTTPRFSTNWLNSAWRLADVFDVILDPEDGKPDVQTKLVPPQSDGKLNINSIARDGGTAFRALLRGFKFLSGTGSTGAPFGDSQLAGTELTESEIDKIIAAFQKYLLENGPIVERGEISNLLSSDGNPLFSNSSIAEKTMRTMVDRGREEIFRRLIEMLTTRSSSFTVYSVGQAIKENADGEITVLGTSTNGTTYRFDPVIDGKTGDEIPQDHPTDVATGFVPVKLYVRP